MGTYSAEFFDAFAHNYDESRFPFSGRTELFRRQMQEIESRQSPKVLDIGCGEGEFLRSVVARFPTIQAVGLDFSEQALFVAQGAEPRVSWLRTSLDEPLPTGIDRFDVIVSAYVLHHWGDARKVALLADLFTNHLVSGGVILMGDIAFATKKDAEQIREAYIDLWDDDEHYFVFEELKLLLDASGPASEMKVLSSCCGLLVIRKNDHSSRQDR